MAARPPAKKKPIKAPPVPPHKRQVGQYSEATTAVSTFEPEGEYESIDAQFIQERISDTAHQNVRETAFSPAQTSTALQVQHPPRISYSLVKPQKSHQREIEEVKVKEAAPSLEPAATSIIMPSPPSRAGIQEVNDQGPPPYPPATVTTQPLQFPINAFGFTRERQRPAKEYRVLVMVVSLSGTLCLLGYCMSGWLACICLIGTRVAAKMTSKHNADGDYVSAQFCSQCTAVCGVLSLLCCSLIPAAIILILTIIYSL